MPTRNRIDVMLTVVMAVVFFTGAASHAAEWNLNGNGDWNVNGNWVNPATFPNAVDAVADFNKLNITGHRTVNVEQAITIGSMLFGDTSGGSDYYLQPGTAGALTLDVSSGNASIVKSTGRNQHIYAPITLNDNLDVTNNGSGALYLRGGVNTNGNDITFDGTGWTRFQDATAGISGSGNVIKNGSGILVLGNGGATPNHTYIGTTTVNDGVVMYFDNKAVGNHRLNNGMLTDYYRRTNIFSGGLGTGNNQIQIYGDSGFGGGNGNSNWRIGANNSVLQWGSTYFNPTSLRFLTVADNRGPSIYGTVTFQNGLDLNGAARTIYVLGNVSNDPTRSQAKIAGGIQDTAGGGSLIKTGAGQLVLNTANTFTGGIAIDEGSVRVDNNSGLGNGGPLSFTGSGTMLDLRASPTVGDLSGTSTYGLITAGAAAARTLTVNQTGNTTFGGVMEDGSGTVSLVKGGSGVLTLSGANTYTGTTTVSAGALLVNGDASAATGAVSVAGGATLGGTGTIGGPTTSAGGSFLAPGASIGTLTVASALDISGALGGPAGSMLFELGPNPLGDMVTLTDSNVLTIGTGLLEWDDFLFADLGVTAGAYTLFDTGNLIDGTLGSALTGMIGDFNGTLSLANADQDILLTLASSSTGGPVIPEPSTFALSLIGLLGLALVGRRRRLGAVGQA